MFLDPMLAWGPFPGAGLVLAAAALLFLAIAFPRTRPRRGNLDGDPVPDGSIRCKPLLSPWERRVIPSLLRQVPPGHHLCPQVRLLDMLSVVGLDQSRSRVLRNRLGSKSVDFVVIDPAGRAVLVIEMNDSSHDRADRRLRDHLVAEALRQACIPLAVFRPGQRIDLQPWLAAAFPSHAAG